jgi:hypothetical protein
MNAPLRRVVDSRLTEEFPLLLIDTLECGHEYRERPDRARGYGLYIAQRRRCDACAAEHTTEAA